MQLPQYTSAFDWVTSFWRCDYSTPRKISNAQRKPNLTETWARVTVD
jgi:hypothetical protein